jgi:hypothetical protein
VGEQRADRAVQLGVHRDDRKAALDGRDRDARAELDGTRDVDDAVQVHGLDQLERVLEDGGRALLDRGVELVGVLHPHRLHAGLGVGALGVGERPVRDRDQPHPGHRVDDLVGQPAAHETGADHADADRPVLRLAAGERGVQDQHQRASTETSESSGQPASLSETTTGGIGQSTPIAGSSQRRPRSAPGV